MPIIHITSLTHPGVEVFSALTEAQLRQRLEPGKGVFIAESPKVIRVAIDAGYEPQALLCEERHITGDAADIIARYPHIPIYTGSRELLASLTGYTLTRGVLCAMHRPAAPLLTDVLREARRVVVIDGVTDTTNIGAIFRSAAALGIDAVLLTLEHYDHVGGLDDLRPYCKFRDMPYCSPAHHATPSTDAPCACLWAPYSSYHGHGLTT